MTALNYFLDKKQVLVSMDTLVCKPNLEPLKFMTKIFPLPHMKSIICGVGNSNLILDWYNFVQTKVVGRDIIWLDRLITDFLLNSNEKYLKEDLNAYCTIYQFGFNSQENVYEGYAYRQEHNFESEKLQYTSACRPGIDTKIIDEVLKNNSNEIDIFINFMIEQKNNQDKALISEKIPIGGEIQICKLDTNGILISTIYEFDDYKKTYDEICSAIK